MYNLLKVLPRSLSIPSDQRVKEWKENLTWALSCVIRVLLFFDIVLILEVEVFMGNGNSPSYFYFPVAFSAQVFDGLDPKKLDLPDWLSSVSFFTR